MAHSRQVVDLIWLHFLDDADEVGTIGQIAVVQLQSHIRFMRILVEVIDAVGVQ